MGPPRHYDPVQRHLAIEALVSKREGSAELRRYYRFRADRWYGGIATADASGCGLLCKFCWASDRALYRPAEIGDFYAPEEVASKLAHIADGRGFRQIRVSGGEPTIGRAHLLRLLEGIDSLKGYAFILETNGILIGHDASYAEDLSKYKCLHARVSLKGCDEEDFSALTGAAPEGFLLQLMALGNLLDAGVECHPAVMASFSPPSKLEALADRLREIDKGLANALEIEELILYDRVAARIGRYGLKPLTFHMPGRVPKELI
ncbi:MAG: radical SAM protein [Candidatus Bathyarchaeia archaeon]